MKTSFQAFLVKIILRLTCFKAVFKNEAALKKAIAKYRAAGPVEPSEKIREKISVKLEEFAGCKVYTLSPKRAGPGKHILYFHGGAYVFDIVKEHWSFLAYLVKRFNCQITVPLYPLAPEHGCEEVLEFSQKLYQKLLSDSPGVSMNLMGDSAGAGLALALAQHMKGKKIHPAERVFLFSPWLDIALDNPGAREVEKRDCMLALPGLYVAAKMYARSLDLRDPRVSPMFGDLKDLPPLELFIGTEDLLIADCRRFNGLAKSAGISINYHEYADMMHVWMLAPMPETQKVIRSLAPYLAQ